MPKMQPEEEEPLEEEPLEELPPTVEGRIPTDEELFFRARNGRYYVEDIWRVVREYPTSGEYECRTDLPGLVNVLYTQVRDFGYELIDSSDRLNGCKHALELTMAWATVVREARTTPTFHLIRRTPENTGAMLMMQRQESLRNQCTEYAPVAYIALIRDQQLVVTRDRVMQQDATERMLVEWARPPAPVVEEEETVEGEEGEVVERVPKASGNMPQALFKQQIMGIRAMLDSMTIARETTGSTDGAEVPSKPEVESLAEGPVEVSVGTEVAT